MAMDEMTDGNPDFKDRSAGLIAFGIIHIVLGGFCALLVPFTLMAAFASMAIDDSASASTSPIMMIPGVIAYILMAVWFIWMGIGSVKARRWARALILVGSWFWLVSGAFALILMAFMLPGMYDQMGEASGGGLPETMARVIMYVTMGFMALFYVVLPGLFVAFYGSRHVKATCEHKDATERWTDRCPLPVLGVSLASAVFASWIPMMGVYGWALPFFGSVLSGPAGAIVAIVFMVILVFVSRYTYRLNIVGWWCAMVSTVVWGASVGITFMRVSLADLYAAMDLPAEQVELMEQYDMLQGPSMVVMTGVWFVAIFAYLLYIKRYFVQSTELSNSE